VHRFVEASARHDNARRLGPVLDRVIPRAGLHARFVNTLARLEYVGVRKMLKSRRADRLDLEGLEHALDETVHALRLKKAALALAGIGDAAAGGDAVVTVATFSDADTLGGAAGEAYFQSLDRRAEAALAERSPALPEALRAEANYLLTSAAIEVRAQVFYPIYEHRLRTHGAPFSVAAIARDEEEHLAAMAARLERALGDWRSVLGPVLAAEEELFGRFLAAVDEAARGPGES
jgi:hypothetical protein